MDIKIVQADGTELEELTREHKEPGKIEGDTEGQIDQIAVKQVLELERDDNEYEGEIQTLIDWAKANGAEDYTDIKWAIRDLRMRLGTPAFGDHIKHVARFAYLDLEEKRIKSEKESFK